MDHSNACRCKGRGGINWFDKRKDDERPFSSHCGVRTERGRRREGGESSLCHLDKGSHLIPRGHMMLLPSITSGNTRDTEGQV